LLTTELNISPMEANNLPASYVMDLIQIHFAAKQLEAEEMDKIKNKK